MATQGDRKLRVGIIGSGGIARAQHIPNYQRHPRAEVIAVADVNEQAARLAADQYGIPHVYTDYADLLARDDVDAVSVATPPNAHYEPVVAAANAGKHILCEKPMALSVAQCDEMISAARAAGVRLMVGYQPRFGTTWQAVRRLIDEGAIGTPHGLNIISVGKAAHPRAWFFDPAIAGGGILMDWGTYTAYMMQYFMGPVESVYALGTTNLHEFTCRDGSVATDIQVEDTVAATLRFANGALRRLVPDLGGARPRWAHRDQRLRRDHLPQPRRRAGVGALDQLPGPRSSPGMAPASTSSIRRRWSSTASGSTTSSTRS